MKTMKIMIMRVILVFLLSTAAVQVVAEDYIRIASFNIAELGEGSHPDTRDLDHIAKMLYDTKLDLIAIQEVGVKEAAESQLNALTQKLNAHLTGNQPRYFYMVTPLTGDERYAVIFRAPVVLGDDISWLDTDHDPSNPGAGGTTYFRVPAAIPFSAGGFDFMVVIVHLRWGNLEGRTAEVAALRELLMSVDESEDDWIVLGDMNRYGKYSKGSTKKAFDQLLKGNWQQRYRFPLLEAITDPDDMTVYRASTDAHSTTVAKSMNIYDQFIITAGAFNEFGTTEPVFGEHVGIVPFDQEAPYKTMDHNSIKYKVSDHRPVWLRFRIDQNDDD